MAHRRSWSWELEQQPAHREASDPTEFTSLGPDGRTPHVSPVIEPIKRVRTIETVELHDAAESHASSKASIRTIRDNVQVSRSQRLYRSLGLESLYLVLHELRNKGHGNEERKLAIIHDFQVACYTSLLHIIPLTASLTLVAFNWKGYYIGSELSGDKGEDGLKILGLQFTAKILELLVMSSLSCIIFAVIRDQLLSGHSLPFGAMTAGFEFSKISIFWSKEFLATCTTRFNSRKSKYGLIATIVVFAILGATIGPSAAVASQPTLKNWSAGGTSFWINGTAQDDLWPLRLENIDDSDLSCTSTPRGNSSCFPPNQDILASEILSYWPLSDRDSSGLQQVIPEETRLAGRRSLRTIAMRFRGPFVYQPDITVATTQLASMADAVARVSQLWFIANRDRCIRKKPGFCNYNDNQHSLKTLQPVTFVKCNTNEPNSTLQFPRLDKEFGLFPLAESPSIFQNDTTIPPLFPSLRWIDLPETDFGNVSIGAIIFLSQTSIAETLTCTIDARWANASSSASFTDGPLVVTGSPKEWYTTGRHERNAKGGLKWPQVKITPSWANTQYPDTTIDGTSNSSTFLTLINSLGRVQNITEVAWHTNAIESILAVMITDAMARIGNKATIQGELKSTWIDEMMPQQGIYDHGGSAFNFTPPLNSSAYTRFEVRTTVNGYGYGVTTATLLATLTLFAYSLIAASYVVHSVFFTRTTSSAWESISEMLALAMNSAPPVSGALDNTGAGISTLSTLKRGVRIAVRDKKLQMDFDGNEDLDLVVKNGVYG
ncbi:hypothetical protein PVAG01_05334 [Phlyctema vagabunda]|uniref:Uncharacterized protein n=1 Tax=Phlyctema vagabunda TaxID=108571 RepID=A0ABR4PJS2_9HELO